MQNGAFGLPNEVSYCSGWYTGGEATAVGTTLLLGGTGIARAGVRSRSSGAHLGAHPLQGRA